MMRARASVLLLSAVFASPHTHWRCLAVRLLCHAALDCEARRGQHRHGVLPAKQTRVQ